MVSGKYSSFFFVMCEIRKRCVNVINKNISAILLFCLFFIFSAKTCETSMPSSRLYHMAGLFFARDIRGFEKINIYKREKKMQWFPRKFCRQWRTHPVCAKQKYYTAWLLYYFFFHFQTMMAQSESKGDHNKRWRTNKKILFIEKRWGIFLFVFFSPHILSFIRIYMEKSSGCVFVRVWLLYGTSIWSKQEKERSIRLVNILYENTL